MPSADIALLGLGVVLSVMTLLWMLSLRLSDVSIVDPFWGPGFLLVALAYGWGVGSVSARGWLAVVLVGVWAARLGTYLLRRNLSKGEDPRYAAMRERGGDSFARVSLFTIFWLQGFLIWIISAPLYAAILSTRALGVWDYLGTTLFVVGFSFEAVADAQLEGFRANPDNRGNVLDKGLWRYSRHPNYFGNAVLWWGLYSLAVGAGAAWTVFAPVIMTFMLMKVSGVTLLEQGLRSSRPGYAEYVRRTSAFIPMPPRA